MISGGFEKREKNGVEWYAVSFLEKTGLVRAAFTTRVGGVSTGETASLNFSFKRKDTAANVRENYRRICVAAGYAPDSLVISRQVHETHVHEVTDEEIGRGIFDDYINLEADGLMTDRRGVALVKHSADCVSVYLLDTQTPAVAMLHAGWRGTVEGIVGEALRRMHAVYGTRPQDCLAAIGPSIGPCCFLVGKDVAAQFESRFSGRGIVDYTGSQPSVNLWKCNVLQLLDAGVPDENIAVAGLCTACDTQTFFSHRKEKGMTGSMAGILELL